MKGCTLKCHEEMNFGIELSFSLWEFMCSDLEEPKFDLIRISCGDQLYDLSLTFSSFLSVASISFPKLFFYQTKYQDGLAPVFSHQISKF